MCLSNEAAAIKLAERDNLVGELVEALQPFVSATLTPTGQVIGLMREDFERAKSAIAKAREGAQS